MTLVDTSILIDKLRKNKNPKTLLFDRLHATKAPFCISFLTYHEILQGAKSDNEFQKLSSYLSTQTMIALPETPDVYADSAKLYFKLRRLGVTVRNTIDVMIAYTAVYYKLPLLHNDRDFDLIADSTPELIILNAD